jgi:hypothetical protein
MGRPLHKKFFGNRNIGSASVTTDDGIGGSRVGSVTVGGVNNSTGYTTGDAVTFTAPQLPGGVTATGTVVAAAGVIVSITIVEAGSGYTSVPTATAGTGTIGTTTLTAVFQADTGAVSTATNQENAITVFAFVTGGSRKVGDIIKQVSGTRYKVRTADGTMICKLKASAASAAGEMDIQATDAAAGTYFVTKLTSHRARLTQGTGVVFANNTSHAWTLGTATATVAKIPNA